MVCASCGTENPSGFRFCEVPPLIVATARPELLDRRSAWGGGKLNATPLALSPLSDQEAAQIVGRVLNDDRGAHPRTPLRRRTLVRGPRAERGLSRRDGHDGPSAAGRRPCDPRVHPGRTRGRDAALAEVASAEQPISQRRLIGLLEVAHVLGLVDEADRAAAVVDEAFAELADFESGAPTFSADQIVPIVRAGRQQQWLPHIRALAETGRVWMATLILDGRAADAAELLDHWDVTEEAAFASLLAAEQLVAAGKHEDAAPHIDRVLAFARIAAATQLERRAESLLALSP